MIYKVLISWKTVPITFPVTVVSLRYESNQSNQTTRECPTCMCLQETILSQYESWQWAELLTLNWKVEKMGKDP